MEFAFIQRLLILLFYTVSSTESDDSCALIQTKRAVILDTRRDARFDPFSKSSRIAIIGAGPAGVHIASRLKQLGYRNLTLLERTERVGGKSYTIYSDVNGSSCTQGYTASGSVDTSSCIAHEMGTCYLHNGYHVVRNLVEEYGLTPEIVPDGRAVFSKYTDKWHSQELSAYVSASILECLKNGTISVPEWARLNDELSVLFALVEAVEKYVTVHKKIFGEVEFSMPSRPSRRKLRKLDMSFAEFLEANGLHAVKGFLQFAHTAQGYGYVKSIPAFYGLTWISPEVIEGFIRLNLRPQLLYLMHTRNSFPKKLRRWVVRKVGNFLADDVHGAGQVTTMLPEGYEKIWHTIVEREDLNVLYGIEIDVGGIDRQTDNASAPVLITYKHRGTLVTEEYDFLIYTAPYAHAGKYVKDLAEAEASAFSKLRSFVLSTTLYKSDAVAGYTDAASDKPIMYNVEKMHGPETDGGWYTDRWDARVHAAQDSLPGRRQTRIAYQFFEDACRADSGLCDSDRVPDPYLKESAEVRNRFLQDLHSQSVANVDVIRQFPWPYFHHYERPEVVSGVPWDVVDMQGLRKTWWLGASAFFESVHDVTNYNLMIMNKYLGTRFRKDGTSGTSYV